MPPTRQPSQTVAPIADAPLTFYVRKRAVPEMLAAIRGAPGQQPSQANPYGKQPIPGLQDRTDLSGKFARKVGQNCRALKKADDAIQDERMTLIKKHARRFPEGHERAGDFMPVFASVQTAEGPKPVFVKDHAGNDTETRVVIPDTFDVPEHAMEAFKHDVTEMLDEYVAITCPGFTEDDWNKFASAPQERSPIGKIIEPLMDLERDGETTKPPTGWVSAIDATQGDRVLELSRDEPDDVRATAP